MKENMRKEAKGNFPKEEEMTEEFVMKRVRELCRQRNWTIYRLAKQSGIPYSTLNNMLKRTNTPTMSTLLKLCKGFGITMAQFFSDGDDMKLTEEQKQLMRLWGVLEIQEKSLAEAYLKGLAGKRLENIEGMDIEEGEHKKEK